MSDAPGDGQGAVADEIALVRSVLRGYPQSFARGDALRAVEKIETALAAPGATIAAREQELLTQALDVIEHADTSAENVQMAKRHHDLAQNLRRALASPAAAPTSQPNAAAQEQPLRPGEQEAIIEDPNGLACLINYYDCEMAADHGEEFEEKQRSLAWMLKRQHHFLTLGRMVILQDPEIWEDGLKAQFAPRPSEGSDFAE